MRAAIVPVVVVLLVSGAEAQPAVSASGNIEGPVALPPTFTLHDRAFLYEENADVPSTALEVDVGPTAMVARYDMTSEPAPGHTILEPIVSCYMIHFSPETDPLDVEGRVRMEGDTVLLGIAFTDAALAATDAVCKPSGVTYPDSPDSTRGLGFVDAYDWLEVGADHVSVGLSSFAGYVDQARIIVARTSPEDAGVEADAGAGAGRDAGTAVRRDAGAIAASEWDYRGSGGCTCTVASADESASPFRAAHVLFALALSLALFRRGRS